MQLLDGKALSQEIKKEIAREVKELKKNKATPHLVAVLIGNNTASETYVGAKIKACKEVGFKSTLLRYDEEITQEELLRKIKKLNEDSKVHGILVQLPLPLHISVDKVTQAIAPEKDVDGFHPLNIGRMAQNLPCYIPATPKGIITLLKKTEMETVGAHCVVVGRSDIVGTPVSILMSRDRSPGNCTVTLCHKATKNLKKYTQQADILITAVGIHKLITADMVKEGAIVIDVGINRVEDKTRKKGYRLRGDVDFEEVAPKCSYITPVPGGVGPMTIASLLQNTLKAAKREVQF